MSRYLAKVLALAGTVRPYKRFEHGREERVSGYAAMRMLRELGGSGDFDKAASDLEFGMRPDEAQQFSAHVASAHRAMQAGDHDMAHNHLINAKNRTVYASGSARSLGSVTRSAMSAQQNLHKEASTRADTEGVGAKLLKHMFPVGARDVTAPAESRMRASQRAAARGQGVRHDNATAELARLNAKARSGKFLMPHEMARREHMQAIVEGRG